MKILFATDGSAFAQSALEDILVRPWPPRTQVRVLSVIHPVPFIGDPFLLGAAIHVDSLIAEEKRAAEDVELAEQLIRKRSPKLETSTVVLKGSPKHRIVEEAEEWGADLVVMGSHGRGQVGRFLLGSVAHAVVQHAPCSVEIVRARKSPRSRKGPEARKDRASTAPKADASRARPAGTKKREGR